MDEFIKRLLMYQSCFEHQYAISVHRVVVNGGTDNAEHVQHPTKEQKGRGYWPD